MMIRLQQIFIFIIINLTYVNRAIGQIPCIYNFNPIDSQKELDSLLIKYPDCNSFQNLHLYSEAINNIRSLDHLVKINNLIIQDVALDTLKFSSELKEIGTILINDCRSLKFIADFSNINIIKRFNLSKLNITHLPFIKDTHIEEIFLSDLTKLNNLSGIHVDTINEFQIFNIDIENDSLFKKISMLNLLNVTKSKISINAIPRTRIHQLTLDQNIIYNIKFLDSINGIRRLFLEANENIDFCNTNFICNTLLNSPDSISINFNGPNCQTNEQVKNQCINLAADYLDHIKIYPNPTNGLLNISGLEGNALFTLFDVNGKPIYKSSSLQYINISDFSGGIYILVIETNRFKQSYKLVKID